MLLFVIRFGVNIVKMVFCIWFIKCLFVVVNIGGVRR